MSMLATGSETMATGVAVGVGVGVGLGVGTGVGVGVAPKGVGVGVGPGLGAWIPAVRGEPVLKKPIVALAFCGGRLESNRKL